MEEKLEKKIDEVLDYIMSKPVEQITHEDFAIMATELKERRFRNETAKQRDKSVLPQVHLGHFTLAIIHLQKITSCNT